MAMDKRKYPDATDPHGELERFANNIAHISWFGDDISIVLSVVRPRAGVSQPGLEHRIVARLVVSQELADVLGKSLLAALATGREEKKSPAAH